jgi:hypothetical protein
MSPGLSPSPSPRLTPMESPIFQLETDIQHPLSAAPMSDGNSNTQNATSSTTAAAPAPFRRGLVTPTTDFDSLLTFKDETPALPPNDGKKKRKHEVMAADRKEIKEEPKEVSMACQEQVNTPEMSWVLRRGGLVAGKGGNVGNGEGGPTDGGSGEAGAGKGMKVNKRAARRTGVVPKRPYVWKDAETKNKAHFQKKPEVEGKGKGKEVVKEEE